MGPSNWFSLKSEWTSDWLGTTAVHCMSANGRKIPFALISPQEELRWQRGANERIDLNPTIKSKSGFMVCSLFVRTNAVWSGEETRTSSTQQQNGPRWFNCYSNQSDSDAYATPRREEEDGASTWMNDVTGLWILVTRISVGVGASIINQLDKWVFFFRLQQLPVILL